MDGIVNVVVYEELIKDFEYIANKARRGCNYGSIGLQLLKEETTETEEAQTPEEFLDGYCDTVVTLNQTPQEDIDTSNLFSVISNIVEKVKEYEEEGITFDLEGALEEVSRSNLTKVPELSLLYENRGDIMEALSIECYDIRQENGLDSITPKVVVDRFGKSRAVWLDSNGKVRKPSMYVPPNLKPYIKENTYEKQNYINDPLTTIIRTSLCEA